MTIDEDGGGKTGNGTYTAASCSKGALARVGLFSTRPVRKKDQVVHNRVPSGQLILGRSHTPKQHALLLPLPSSNTVKRCQACGTSRPPYRKKVPLSRSRVIPVWCPDASPQARERVARRLLSQLPAFSCTAEVGRVWGVAADSLLGGEC